MNKFFVVIFAVFLSLNLVGCGGSSDDGGSGLSPQQQEYADVLYTFAAYINNQDTKVTDVMIDSGLIYNGNPDHDAFKDRLVNFLECAENVKFNVNDIGVTIVDDVEKIGYVSANVTYDYQYRGESFNKSENLELKVRKYSSNWAITMFHGSRSELAEFPPILTE